MSEEKFTKGPWSQYGDDPLVIVDKDGASLGEMTPGDPYTTPMQALANARLVAAAPDLLAVVADMLSGLRYLREANTVPYGFGIDRLEETGRAAISKALAP